MTASNLAADPLSVSAGVLTARETAVHTDWFLPIRFHKQSCVRLNFKPSKIVVLEFGAERYAQAIVKQTDFILRECAKLVQAGYDSAARQL